MLQTELARSIYNLKFKKGDDSKRSKTYLKS